MYKVKYLILNLQCFPHFKTKINLIKKILLISCALIALAGLQKATIDALEATDEQ
jgi:hypothetical protein